MKHLKRSKSGWHDKITQNTCDAKYRRSVKGIAKRDGISNDAVREEVEVILLPLLLSK